MRVGRSEVRGALIVRSEVTRSRVEGSRATHQKFSWISSSAAASQMVGPITSSSSSSSMFISSVSREARVGCEPGKRPPANEAGVFFVHPEDFLSGEQVSFPHLSSRLRDGKRTDMRVDATHSVLAQHPVHAMNAGVPPKARLKAMLKRPNSPVREEDREEGENRLPGVPDTADAVWRPNTKDEVGRARLTLLRWGETGKRKRREPASARAMRGELRVSIPFNPMSATPITILSRA